MHFHLPKPLHGWRAFVGEVGIIVVGVLIALSAEQVVERWHWRGEVRETDRRMRDDMGYNLATAAERFAIDPCLRPRLGELRDELLKNDPMWPGSRARFANDLYKSGFPSVYRTPNRPWMQASWLTALNGEVLGHFKPDRVQQFALLKVVAKLDALDARLLFEAQVLLKDGRKAGLAPDPTAAREGIEQQQSYRGNCVRAPALKG